MVECAPNRARSVAPDDIRMRLMLFLIAFRTQIGSNLRLFEDSTNSMAMQRTMQLIEMFGI